ncbi:MAG TPA: acyl-CoA dehydrogenase family protein, partial [Nitrospiraceae bacterium]|nr:acyl-CoA dehydrogenase family protein [Nitrospiraceae bacterium]
AWRPTLDRARSRYTFQKPLAERQTQQVRIGRMAADLFAMESLAHLVWRLADQHQFDIRIEAAIAKIFSSEATIRFLKDAQTLFGGMGYETADSKRLRGEPAFGIEQLVRDAEMYRIGEGATDIMRPFVSREGLNPHLERAQAYFNEGTTGSRKVMELLKLARFYIPWYLRLWKRAQIPLRPEFLDMPVLSHLTLVERLSRKLARAIYYAMVMKRESLRDDQGRQNRIEMIGEDLLVIASATLRARREARESGRTDVWELVERITTSANERITHAIRELIRNRDQEMAESGRHALAGQYDLLSNGVVQRSLNDYLPKTMTSSGPVSLRSNVSSVEDSPGLH